ncbi:unnamed protein product [Cuscuta campestris]|uniref:Retrovirus-related Pol polyprotein from transposon TNT 1-94-like beta-barrel domain-containing protein n=1 Tax=Cuscuta campestris TaxID=132261 RepID=A0A484NBS8_9ASTE|nr:unnamed protein product [Cuscuta campestris]
MVVSDASRHGWLASFTGWGVICRVVGIGSIRLKTHNGTLCTSSEVRHNPFLTKNLISLAHLDRKGFNFQGF